MTRLAADLPAVPLRLVVADDHPVFRTGLQAILDEAADFEVVAAVSDGEAVIAAVAACQPDVVLMDLRMPGVGGVEATARICRTQPHPAVLALTMSDDDDSVFATLRAGARGYLLKEASTDDIMRAVRSVARGEAVFGPRIADRVIAFFAAAPRGSGPAPFPRLTARARYLTCWRRAAATWLSAAAWWYRTRPCGITSPPC